jgi:hypothetical protein
MVNIKKSRMELLLKEGCLGLRWLNTNSKEFTIANCQPKCSISISRRLRSSKTRKLVETA